MVVSASGTILRSSARRTVRSVRSASAVRAHGASPITCHLRGEGQGHPTGQLSSNAPQQEPWAARYREIRTRVEA
jgi:ribosomal protein L19E